MNFLTDENIYKPIITHLRELGHDVLDIKKLKLFGISADEILKIALKENRILITLDTDFADIRFLPTSCHGVIVLRFKSTPISKIIVIIEQFLKQVKPDDIKNSLVILEEDKFRIRHL